MKRLGFVGVIATALLFTGCISSSFGTKMSQGQVDQIKKGVSTKADVETILGQPVNTSMIGDGRRVMTYSYFAQSARAKGQSFIPYLGPFIGGATGEREQQTLQIYLDKNGVVEDYEFSDSLSTIDSRGGIFNQQIKSTPVPVSAPKTEPVSKVGSGDDKSPKIVAAPPAPGLEQERGK